MIYKKIRCFLLSITIAFNSCDSSNQKTTVGIKYESNKFYPDSSYLISKIQQWQDSIVFEPLHPVGFRITNYLCYLNDSVLIDSSWNNIPADTLIFKIKSNTMKTTFTLRSEKSYAINIPSINRYRVIKYENETFYLILDSAISPSDQNKETIEYLKKDTLKLFRFSLSPQFH
jgi:hypothetical protein